MFDRSNLTFFDKFYRVEFVAFGDLTHFVVNWQFFNLKFSNFVRNQPLYDNYFGGFGCFSVLAI